MRTRSSALRSRTTSGLNVACFLVLVTPSELLHHCTWSSHLCIVACFLVLVTPSELLHLCYYVVRHDNAPVFELALVAANVLQTANFALNFLLYCACNSQFRDTWKHLLVSHTNIH